MQEVFKEITQDFLDNLAKVLLALALFCKWIANMTLAGY